MSDPMKKFRDEVELMSLNEIQTLIDARTAEMNGHTMARTLTRRLPATSRDGNHD